MDDKQQQLEHLREAVDRKSEAAEAASRQPGHPSAPQDEKGPGEQPPLHDTAYTQDAASPRAKNSGKGKKTADKWNQ